MTDHLQDSLSNPASLAQTFAPMTVSNDLLLDSGALQERMDRDGYLFFRNLIPAETVLNLREAMLEVLVRHGCILDGPKRNDAISVAMPFREGEDAFFEVYDDIVKLELFYALAHHPKLTTMMRGVLGETAFPHPLSITRLVFPENPEITTPPHQDFPNNQGSPDLTATWIPLGDCPSDLGGLAVLEGSHKTGVLPLKAHLGAGNRQADLSSELSGLRWVSADFAIGDVLVFGAMTVHAARVNADPEKMRLSVDFRFQREGEPLTPICLQPHFERFSWEQIYDGWRSDDLKYYWKNKRFEVVAFDENLHSIDEGDLMEGVKQSMVYNAARKRRFKSRSEKLKSET